MQHLLLHVLFVRTFKQRIEDKQTNVLAKLVISCIKKKLYELKDSFCNLTVLLTFQASLITTSCYLQSCSIYVGVCCCSAVFLLLLCFPLIVYCFPRFYFVNRFFFNFRIALSNNDYLIAVSYCCLYE